MKNLLKSNNTILLLIITSFFFSCKENKKYDLKGFDLNGNVETVSYIYKEASEKFGKVIEGKIIADSLITLSFNNKGQLTDSTWNNHKYLKKIEYEKDLRKRETYISNKSVISYIEFLYTADGKISEKTNYDKSKKIVRKKMYKYNQNSSIVNWYNANGDLIARETFKYDSDDNLIEIKTSSRKTTFKYRDDMLCEKIVIENKLIEKDCYEKYAYDYFSKLKYEQTITIKSNYDKNGNISKYNYEIYNDAETIHGGCKSYGWSEGSTTIIEYKYQSFDKFKNWTKQIVKSDYGIDHLINRKISYRKE